MRERLNVEALAEIPLQREKDGRMEEWMLCALRIALCKIKQHKIKFD
jgi:hypothetical protein